MRVLVTGGAGFIGSHVVDQLIANGHEPAVVDNLVSGSPDNIPADVPLYEIDICDSEGLERAIGEFKPECVCHQAAQMSVSRSVREPVFDAQVNVLGLLNVFDLAIKHGAKRIVFASSGGVLYGDVYEPVDENHLADPISPYGISKWVGEQYLRFYAREYGINGVALRYANVYGPRQNPHGEAGVVAIFSRRMLAGEQITVNGDGKYIRDYVYAGDVARANVMSLESGHSDNFVALNIGTGTPTDVNELAAHVIENCRAIHAAAGKSIEIPKPGNGSARAGDLRSSLIDAGLAEKTLGWKPTVKLADGLKQTVDWFAANAPA